MLAVHWHCNTYTNCRPTTTIKLYILTAVIGLNKLDFFFLRIQVTASSRNSKFICVNMNAFCFLNPNIAGKGLKMCIYHLRSTLDTPIEKDRMRKCAFPAISDRSISIYITPCPQLDLSLLIWSYILLVGKSAPRAAPFLSK